MARLIAFASEDDRIGPIMRTPEYSFRTTKGRVVTVRNTNQILRAGDIDVLGGKTGFISKAGYCLATLLKMPHGGPVARGRRPRCHLERRTGSGKTRHLMAWLAERTQLLGLDHPRRRHRQVVHPTISTTETQRRTQVSQREYSAS